MDVWFGLEIKGKKFGFGNSIHFRLVILRYFTQMFSIGKIICGLVNEHN